MATPRWLPLVVALALGAPAFAGEGEGVADGDAADDRLVGPVPGEVKAFRETEARYSARMQEMEADTRSYVDLREAEERQKLSAGYDALISTLTELEEGHRLLAVEKMEGFIERYPDARYADHVRFRLADLYFEDAKDEWLIAAEKYAELEAELGFERMDELPPMPKIDLQPSIDLYERIIADNRGRQSDDLYEHLDGCFYMLGFCYNEPNSAQHDDELARSAFAELIATRPDSDLADAAHLFLGNFYFDENDFEGAIAEYQMVFDRGEEGLYYPESMYQLAWAYYKLAGPEVSETSMGPEAYDKALELFTMVLDRSEEEVLETGRESDFAPDAVKYIAISFSDIADNTDVDPITVAENYFAKVGARDYEWEIYVQLGEVLTQQALFTESISVYERLQDDPRWRLRPENPQFQMKVVKLHVSGPFQDIAASAAARVELTEKYNDSSDWWAANRSNPEAIATARGYIESSLADVAIEYRLKADASGEAADYLIAAEKFKEYLDKFPISDDYYEQQWYLADTLFRAGAFDESLPEYTSLIKSGAHHEYHDGAVFRMWTVRHEILKTEHTPPALPEELLVPELIEFAATQKAPLWMVPRLDAETTAYQTEGGGERSIYELTEDHQAFVDATRAVLEHEFEAPQGKQTIDYGEAFTKSSHKVKYLLAQMLFIHGRFDEVRPILAEIIEEYPDRNEAAFCAKMMVTSYTLEGDLAKVRLFTKKYMTLVLGEDVGIIGESQESFASLLEETAFKQAAAYVELGDRKAAAEAFLEFMTEFPESEHVPKALYNAAHNYEKVGKAELANDLFEDYVNRYPGDELSKTLYFRIAANYESTFDLEKAIDYYERLVRIDPEYTESADALFNSTFLRIGLGDHQGAAEGFERYARLYPDREDREDVYYMAGDEWERVSPAKAKAFYEKYLKTYGLEVPDHAFEAKYKLAQYARDEGSTRRYESAMDSIMADYDRLAAQGTEIGGSASHYAAEAAFRHLRLEYEKFIEDELTGDEVKDITMLMDEKPPQLLQFEEHATGLVKKYGDFEYSTASLFLLGTAYIYYSDLGFALQPPPGLSPEEEDVFWELLETEVLPRFYIVQDKAVARFEQLITVSRKQKRYSVWVGKAYEELNRLDPRGYPKEIMEIEGLSEATMSPKVEPLRFPGDEAPAAEDDEGQGSEEVPWQ